MKEELIKSLIIVLSNVIETTELITTTTTTVNVFALYTMQEQMNEFPYKLARVLDTGVANDV